MTRLHRRPQFHLALLVIAAIGMLAPYAIAGPALFRDDWFTIRNAELDSWWMAAGSSQWRARPVGAAIYAVTFGLVGQRPLVHYVLASAVVIGIALLLYVLSARYLGRLVALGVAFTWLLLPNHTSLEMWPSALNIAVAVLLTLVGIERLTHPGARRRDEWLAAVAFAVGLLAYEAVGPASVVAVLAVGATRPRRRRVATALPSLVLLGLAGLWMLANWHPEKKGLEATLDPWFVVPGHFGYSIVGDAQPASAVVPVAVLVASVLALHRLLTRDRTPSTSWVEPTLLIGWSLIALGTLPFIRYFYAPIGFGDRVTAVSGLGGALVLVATVAVLARWWIGLGVLFAGVLFVGMLIQRTSMVMAYATAADDSRRIFDAIEARWPEPPDHPVVFGPAVVDRHVRAFEPMEFPVQVLYGTQDVEVRTIADPAAFDRQPEDRRLDLREHSKLDDGRLGPPSVSAKPSG